MKAIKAVIIGAIGSLMFLLLTGAFKLTTYVGEFVGDGSALSNVAFTTQITPSAGFSNRTALAVNTINCGPTAQQRIFVNLFKGPINWGNIGANGYDIKVFDSDGSTPLTYYRQSFTSTNATLIVVFPVLSGSGVHPFFVDTGNASVLSDTISSLSALTYQPNLKNSTVARWLFNDGSGSTAADTSDSLTNATLTIVGGFWSNNAAGPAPFNRTYLHLPSGAYCQVALPNAFNTQPGFDVTYSFWMRFPGSFPANSVFFCKSWNGVNDYNLFYSQSSTLRAIISEGNNAFLGVAPSAPSSDVWHLFNIVGTESGSYLYIDGNLVVSGPAYAGEENALSSGRALVFNADFRSGGSPTANTSALDLGPCIIEFHSWSGEQVVYEYNWMGQSIPKLEKDKWAPQGIIPGIGWTNSPGNPQWATNVANFGEASRFKSSYDGLYKTIHTGPGGGTGDAFLSESSYRDNLGTYVGKVLGDGVGGLAAGVHPIHNFALDDTLGNIIVYWISNRAPWTIYFSKSSDGGHTFTSAATNNIPIGFLMHNNSVADGNAGNLSVSPLSQGPLSGNIIWMVDNQPYAAGYQEWIFKSQSLYGPLTPLNGGYPVTIWTANGNNPPQTNCLNDVSGLFWANQRYQMWGQFQSPGLNAGSITKMMRASTTDGVTWTLEPGSGLEVGRDANVSRTQIGDQRNPDFSGGICGIFYNAVNNRAGQPNNSLPDTTYAIQSGFTNWINTACYATFQGSLDQLVSPGSHFVSYYATNTTLSGSSPVASQSITSIGALSSIIATNFGNGQIYTNNYGVNIFVTANAALTAAAVSGQAALGLHVYGLVTNLSSLNTTALSIPESYTNTLSGYIPSGSTYAFTNLSSGSGNSATVVGGQILLSK